MRVNKNAKFDQDVVVFCFVALLGTCVWAENNLKGEATDSGKIRAGFLGWWNTDVVPQMAQCGMTHVLPTFASLSIPVTKPDKERIYKWALVCREAGIKFMPIINLWGGYEKDWIRPKRHLYYKGIEYSKTPCILEAEVYKRSVHDRVLMLAELSRSVPIAGIVIDLEMYGADVVDYPDCCLCDYCFERFLTGTTVSRPIPRAERYDYIVSSGQLAAYKDFMRNSVAELARHTREQVELIAPEFKIGVLRLDQNRTFNAGLAKGLGSENKPVLAFAENTYSTGYSSYIQKTQKRFEAQKINAQLIVGICPKKLPPEVAAEQYYHCAKVSAGYWIYTMEYFSSIILTQDKKYREAIKLPDKERHWKAIKIANEELYQLSLNPDYTSFLKAPALH